MTWHLRWLPFAGFARPPPPHFCPPEGTEGRQLPRGHTDATCTRLGLRFEGPSSQRTTEAPSQLPHLRAGHSPAPGSINKSREVILSQETGTSLKLQSCSVSSLGSARVHCCPLTRNRAGIEPGPRLQLSVQAQAEGVVQGAETQTEMPCCSEWGRERQTDRHKREPRGAWRWETGSEGKRY